MKNQIRILPRVLPAIIALLVTCGMGNAQDNKSLTYVVEEAADWTALFNRNSGWFGGDGIFAIPLDGKDNQGADSVTETMIIFSDTMLGEIENNKIKPGHSMVHNSVAYFRGVAPKEDKIRFHWNQDKLGKPYSLFTPQTVSSQEGDYYWLGDGFLNRELGNRIYIFAYRMRTMDKNDDWSFKEMGTDLIVLPSGITPPFEDRRQIESPLRFEDGGFGAGIFVNTVYSGAPNPDGFIYVYGVRGMEKKLMVARVLPGDFENFDAWRFWDGKEWNKDMHLVAYVADGVSNELSVTALEDGKYALVFTLNGINPIVGLRFAESPLGPFGPLHVIYEAQEMKQKNYITYNAKAHPHLSVPGELLISYNVNAFDFGNEIQAHPNLYRPRFIKIKFSQLN